MLESNIRPEEWVEVGLKTGGIWAASAGVNVEHLNGSTTVSVSLCKEVVRGGGTGNADTTSVCLNCLGTGIGDCWTFDEAAKGLGDLWTFEEVANGFISVTSVSLVGQSGECDLAQLVGLTFSHMWLSKSLRVKCAGVRVQFWWSDQSIVRSNSSDSLGESVLPSAEW